MPPAAILCLLTKITRTYPQVAFGERSSNLRTSSNVMTFGIPPPGVPTAWFVCAAAARAPSIAAPAIAACPIKLRQPREEDSLSEDIMRALKVVG
jgi:hypothetical protein